MAKTPLLFLSGLPSPRSTFEVFFFYIRNLSLGERGAKFLKMAVIFPESTVLDDN